jgi:hypothetical protein
MQAVSTVTSANAGTHNAAHAFVAHACMVNDSSEGTRE